MKIFNISLRKGMMLIASMLLLLTGLTLGGCHDMPKYGNLEGLWEITSLTDSDGQEVPFNYRRYFAFQGNVVQLRYDDGLYFDCTGNFEYSDNVITMDFPYVSEMRDPTVINNWGIFTDPISLQVVERTDKHLVLRNDADGWIWVCRKF